MKKTLQELRRLARDLNVKIIAVRDDVGWGYWLEGTGWEDENFCTSREEIFASLKKLQQEKIRETLVDMRRNFA